MRTCPFTFIIKKAGYLIMGQVDLHVHSTSSDGTYTPTELVNYAIEKGLDAFALTDHDTVDGIDEALAAATGKPIRVIPGIEYSTRYLDRDVHIVGLFIDYQSPDFRAYLDQFMKLSTLLCIGSYLLIAFVPVPVDRHSWDLFRVRFPIICAWELEPRFFSRFCCWRDLC